jgi:hypothetical protein
LIDKQHGTFQLSCDICGEVNYALDQYTGNNFKLAPDRMQEIVRAMWAIRPEMKEGAA